MQTGQIATQQPWTPSGVDDNAPEADAAFPHGSFAPVADFRYSFDPSDMLMDDAFFNQFVSLEEALNLALEADPTSSASFLPDKTVGPVMAQHDQVQSARPTDGFSDIETFSTPQSRDSTYDGVISGAEEQANDYRFSASSSAPGPSRKLRGRRQNGQRASGTACALCRKMKSRCVTQDQYDPDAPCVRCKQFGCECDRSQSRRSRSRSASQSSMSSGGGSNQSHDQNSDNELFQDPQINSVNDIWASVRRDHRTLRALQLQRDPVADEAEHVKQQFYKTLIKARLESLEPESREKWKAGIRFVVPAVNFVVRNFGPAGLIFGGSASTETARKASYSAEYAWMANESEWAHFPIRLEGQRPALVPETWMSAPGTALSALDMIHFPEPQDTPAQSVNVSGTVLACRRVYNFDVCADIALPKGFWKVAFRFLVESFKNLPDDKTDKQLNSWQFRKDTPFINSLYDIRLYAGVPTYSYTGDIEEWRGHDTANGRIAINHDCGMVTKRIGGDMWLDNNEYRAGREHSLGPMGNWDAEDAWDVWWIESPLKLADEVNHVRLVATRSHGEGSPRSRADHELYGGFMFGGAWITEA